jgi:hypothetical protein
MQTSMPYPFAHPAAILPLAAAMGRTAVPSALALGSMIPDAWYVVPLLTRDDSHSLGGLFWFCLPAGLAAYLAFHLLLKQPLLALLPEPAAARLAPFAFPKLPAAGWPAVLASLLAGALTHFAWDALIHEKLVVHGFQVLQHASTLLGTAILAAWLVRWFRRTPARELPAGLRLSPRARRGMLGLLIVLSAGWALAGAGSLELPQTVDEWRDALRTTGMAGVQALALSTIGYAMLWKLLR